MKNKVLTISIAAFNVEKYIRNTLESLIVSDNFDELEVLIINDGSTDSTSSVAAEYVRRYPNVFKLINKENGGYGSTINTAVKVASGRYFKQLDGDDWFDTDNLSEFIIFLKLNDADCIYSPYWKVYQNSEERQLYTPDSIKKDTIDAKDIAMHALTFKTRIFTDNNISITKKCFYTDCEYNVKPLFFTNTIDYFNKPVYCYRLDLVGQSVSREGWKKHYCEHNKVTLELMSYYENNIGKRSVLYETAIEDYILGVYKTNLYIALELADKGIQEEYRKLDLDIKTKHPMFYKKKNMKMHILAKSGYKFWCITRVFHGLFEKNIII